MSESFRVRQIIYRANHRGIKEMDILLGRYAQAKVPSMTEAEIMRFEALLDLPDSELLAWITGADAMPAGADSDMLAAIARHAASSTREE
jgi:antitoxin CptB